MRRASDLHLLMAPVELVGVARRKAQRHERLAGRRKPALLLPPLAGVAPHRVVGAAIALPSEQVVDARQRQPVPLGGRRVGLQHRLQPLHEGPKPGPWLLFPLVDEAGLA